MNSITELQAMTGEWRNYNFPGYTADEQILGMIEELGELSHAYLKHKQGIRGDENLADQEQDAIGDLIIYLCGFCDYRGYQLADCVARAWSEVKDRDWIKYPGTGRPPVEAS